jgi:hypothetical protein
MAGALMYSELALTALEMMTSCRWCLKSGSGALAVADFLTSSFSYIEESESNPDCDENDRTEEVELCLESFPRC